MFPLADGTDISIDTTPGHATRKPAISSKGTARGSTFYRGTQVYHESEQEHRISVTIQGRNDVSELHSQYPVMLWVDAVGEIRKHTCDFYVVFSDGFRLAVPVKYEKKKPEIKTLISNLRKAGFTALKQDGSLAVGVVDDMKQMSETGTTIDDFENAHDILESRYHHDDAECAALYEIVCKFPGGFRFGDLLRNCVNRAKRRTAIWRLIDRGNLRAASRGRIDELAWLRFRE